MIVISKTTDRGCLAVQAHADMMMIGKVSYRRRMQYRDGTVIWDRLHRHVLVQSVGYPYGPQCPITDPEVMLSLLRDLPTFELDGRPQLDTSVSDRSNRYLVPLVTSTGRRVIMVCMMMRNSEVARHMRE